jgi:hypothetical protein
MRVVVYHKQFPLKEVPTLWKVSPNYVISYVLLYPFLYHSSDGTQIWARGRWRVNNSELQGARSGRYTLGEHWNKRSLPPKMSLISIEGGDIQKSKSCDVKSTFFYFFFVTGV